MLIPEGSKVIVQDNSFNIKHSPVETVTDIDVVGNQLMMFNGYLCCTRSYDSVENLGNGLYQINVWTQDALTVKDECMYESIFDAE